MRKKIPLILSALLFLAFFVPQSFGRDDVRSDASQDLSAKPYSQAEQESELFEKRFLELIKMSVEKYKDISSLDPLFVLALIKAESNFGKYEISSSGAAGPAQLMPFTAEEMGMKVFFPYYYQIALDEREMAAKYYARAKEAASKISFENSPEENERLASQVKLYREIGSWHEAQAKSLFQRYKEELLSKVKDKTDEELMEIDQRFIVPLAIDVCVRILANNARKLNGDNRELASSYNAGLSAVIRSGGIPFINQTVTFQNRVMRFYREYLKDG